MTSPLEGLVVITPRQMYDQLVANTRAVDRLTDTLGPSMATLRADHDALVERFDDFEAVQVEQGKQIVEVRTKLWAAGAALTLLDFAIGVYAVLIHR